MPDPFTALVAGYIAVNAPHWLEDLRNTILDKSKEGALAKGKELLSEKEQERHLQQILKKAVQKGKARFQRLGLQERDRYKDIMTNLFEPGEHSDALRREAMKLFALNDTPNLAELNEIYNRSLRIRNLSQSTLPAKVDAAPYLTGFFEALIAELYADSYFKSQVSDLMQTRMAMVMPQYMSEANATLHKIHEAIKDDYTEEQFEHDKAKYIAYVERVLHNLKIIGFLPKDQMTDPELNGIFVPLRYGLIDHSGAGTEQQEGLVALLERYSCVVLLGDPGSGKSTVVRHMAWSHAKANLESSDLEQVPLLSGCPLPLRIELRLLMQDRKQHPDYSFVSYATEALLGREGIAVNPLMFERLLEQKRMLLLFDGLDEVTTLHERQRLVQEIEHFAQLYPGNYILVTSRPTGYELASCTRPLFTHARVQNFNDEQIRQFLVRWYTHVLRLSPLPYAEQQELEALFKILKENTRLHKLAENPLLLTVITALYRSQRLPEKRVQVYDRCAELLLETWARLKGTDARWADMKIGKDDQFACVAHLGFTLHQRSQEERETQKEDNVGRDTDMAADVPARFMLREIENFLASSKLISEKAEQRKEARLFLELVQVEAGLIVERGTDENEEKIFGFVHRTFQEYFAACDVYERFKQDEDPTIISEFLEEHLHDPHWQEVIFLLLGKLGRKPVTLRLRQILDGRIKSRRSRYTSLVQQDLFFVCDCLAEDMAVESDLAELVVAHLGDVVVTSPFSSQRSEALKGLERLTQTKQYVEIARRELVRLVRLNDITGIVLRIGIVRILYANSLKDTEEEREAKRLLLELAQQADVPVGQRIRAAQTLYRPGSQYVEGRREGKRLLLELAQHADLLAEHHIQAAKALYVVSLRDTEERQEARRLLVELAQQTDIPVEQRIQAVLALYQPGSQYAEERREARRLLIELAQQTDVPVEQRIEAAKALSEISRDVEERSEARRVLLELARRADVPTEHRIEAGLMIYRFISQNSEERREVGRLLLELVQHADVPTEKHIEAIAVLYGSGRQDFEEKREARGLLVELALRTDVPTEQSIMAAAALYEAEPQDSREGRKARELLLELTRRADAPTEHRVLAVWVLYQCSPPDSKERRETIQWIWQLAQDRRITVDQRLQAITIPIKSWSDANYVDRAQALQMLQELLPAEQVKNYVKEHWETSYSNIEPVEIPYIAEIAQQKLLPSRVRDEMYTELRDELAQFDKIPTTCDELTS